MKKSDRLAVLVHQIDLMRELVDIRPEFKDIAIKQLEGMIRYSRAIGDIDYNYEVRFRNKVHEYLNEPLGSRRRVIYRLYSAIIISSFVQKYFKGTGGDFLLILFQ